MECSFEAITGQERYKVTDIETGGEAFYNDQMDAYKHAATLAIRLGHSYRIEDRHADWESIGGPSYF